ncbi:MAG: LytTR family DNA-binding domain-containing protein [Alphaproteobacteria bacterium]
MTASGSSRSVKSIARLGRMGACLLAGALVLALLGPFGTALTMSLPPRSLYWLTTVGLIGGAIASTHWWLKTRFYPRGLPAWVIAAVAIAAAIPGAALVRLCLALWSPGSLEHVTFAGLASQVLLVNMIGGGLTLALRRARGGDVAALHDVPERRACRASAFAERLPPALRQAGLIALEGEDHYLRVHTSAGSALIYLRLSEAEALLKQEDGLRVHRSYWVARNAVEGVTRSQGRTLLRLTGGLIVPVSRARQKALIEARWPHLIAQSTR